MLNNNCSCPSLVTLAHAPVHACTIVPIYTHLIRFLKFQKQNVFQKILSNSDFLFPLLQYFNDNWKTLKYWTKKFQKKVSQMTNQMFPTTMLPDSLSVNFKLPNCSHASPLKVIYLSEGVEATPIDPRPYHYLG